MSIDAVEEEARQALDWFDNSPLSSLVGVNKAFMYADNKGFAKIHLAIKTLADGTKVKTPEIVLEQGSDYTALYHESWHELTQFCMTQKERDELYSELRKLNGTFKEYESGNKVKFSEATNLQLEELLAESLRHYMLTGKTVLENNLTTVNCGNKSINLPNTNRIFKFLRAHFKETS